MDLNEWQKKFRQGFNKEEQKEPKKYEDMDKAEKERYLRERNKKQDFSGFEDGGLADSNYLDILKRSLMGQQEQEISPLVEPEVPEVRPEDIIDAELVKKNEEAKSPYMQTKSERTEEVLEDKIEKTPVGQAATRSPAGQDTTKTSWKASSDEDPMLAKYKKALADYENRLNEKKPEENQVMNWLTALGQAAAPLAKASGRNVVAPKYWGDTQASKAKASKNQDLQGLEKLQSMYNKYLDMQQKGKGKALSALDLAKIATEEARAAKLEKEASADKPSWEDKEVKKFELKEKLADKKERTKNLKQAKESVSNLDSQLEKVRKAKQLLKEMTKNSFVDTGPLDQYAASATEQGQKLRQAFNDLSLDKMTKMFKGMSKAIDSDAERKMFEQSQASLGNYPAANMAILDEMEKGMLSLKQKNSRLMNELQKKGQGQSETVLMQAPNGQTARVKRDQIQKYLDKGAQVIKE